MSGPDRRPASCPVCGLAPDSGTTCAGCGWTLRTPYRLGPVTPQLRQEFDDDLNRARRQLDARTAALISAERDRYRELIRGGGPTDAEWAAARQAAVAATGGAVTDERLRSMLADLTAGLRSGPGTVVVGIGPEGIDVARVRLDQFGSPALTREAGSDGWTTLLPALPAGSQEQLFQLAGPVSDLAREQLPAAISRVTAGLSGTGGLIVCRPAGWGLLERAAQLARDQLPGAPLVRAMPAPGGAALDVLLSTVVGEAPLLCSHGLAVAVVDPDNGSVRVGLRTLFAPGDRPGTEAVLGLRRAGADQSEVTLALLPDGDAGHEPFSAQVVQLPPGPRYRLRAVLDGPGRVRILEPSRARPQAAGWPQILAQVPERIDARPRPLDLVCAIELAGSRDIVRSRIGLVRELLDLLNSDYLAPDLLRVSVLGCDDHIFDRGQEQRRVVRGAPLAPVAEARAALGAFRSSAVRYPHAAPLEDVLREAASQLDGSRRAGRAAGVLTVAGRLPHPYPQGTSPLHPCPLRYQWKVQLRRLTETCGASCVVVADTLPLRPDRLAAWRALGSAAQRELAAVGARQLGEDLGILASTSQRVPIPLADPE